MTLYMGKEYPSIQINVDQARKMFDIAIEVNPVHAKAYFFRGLAYEKMGQLQQAKDNYVQALTFKPDYQLAIDKLKSLESGQ